MISSSSVIILKVIIYIIWLEVNTMARSNEGLSKEAQRKRGQNAPHDTR